MARNKEAVRRAVIRILHIRLRFEDMKYIKKLKE